MVPVVLSEAMIQPAYLAQLRYELRAELVITLVQLEQLVPGWWCSLSDLAEQLGTDRASLNRSLSKLAALGLLRRVSRSNGGGTWIWWVKRDVEDQPSDLEAPRWRLRDVAGGRRSLEVILGQERAFAAAKDRCRPLGRRGTHPIAGCGGGLRRR